MSSEEYDEETSARIHDKLDKILELTSKTRAIVDRALRNYEPYKKSAVINSNQKNNDDVKKSDESAALGDDESVEKLFESNSGISEQRKNDQKATKVIKKSRRVRAARKRSKLTSAKASLNSSTEFAREDYSSRLQIAPLRVFIWKKKYKWDDGG
jgi:hypothetical protein